MTTASGTELKVLLDTRQDGQGRMSLAMETLEPGQHTEPHWHAHVEEIYHILVGQGRMEIDQEAESVRAGDSILIPLNRVHCLYNTGDGDLMLLCVVSPPWYPQDHHSAEENLP